MGALDHQVRHQVRWGPTLDVAVTSLDLRAGGKLVYPIWPPRLARRAFMKQAGMPLTTECKVTYVEVSPPGRLAYKTLTDFVPEIEPYEVSTVVELKPTAGA